jgi:hypothetical protein
VRNKGWLGSSVEVTPPECTIVEENDSSSPVASLILRALVAIKPLAAAHWHQVRSQYDQPTYNMEVITLQPDSGNEVVDNLVVSADYLGPTLSTTRCCLKRATSR